MTKSNDHCFNLKMANCLLKRSESSAQIVLDNNKSFSITLPESSVLKRLIEEKGKIVSREDLIIDAWGRADIIGPNSLPVAITNLRKVLDLNNIKIVNIPKKGYKLVQPSSETSSPESNTPSQPSSTVSETAKPALNSHNDNTTPHQETYQNIKFRIALIAASSGLILTLYASFYIWFSWVSLDCQQNGQATLCTVQGDNVPLSIVDGKQGLFYTSTHNPLIEVAQND